MNIAYIVILVIAAIFGIIRLSMKPEKHVITKVDVFKAFAHIFVGGVFGAFLATWIYFYLWVGLGLSILELYAFLASKIKLSKAV